MTLDDAVSAWDPCDSCQYRDQSEAMTKGRVCCG